MGVLIGWLLAWVVLMGAGFFFKKSATISIGGGFVGSLVLLVLFFVAQQSVKDSAMMAELGFENSQEFSESQAINADFTYSDYKEYLAAEELKLAKKAGYSSIREYRAALVTKEMALKQAEEEEVILAEKREAMRKSYEKVQRELKEASEKEKEKIISQVGIENFKKQTRRTIGNHCERIEIINQEVIAVGYADPWDNNVSFPAGVYETTYDCYSQMSDWERGQKWAVFVYLDPNTGEISYSHRGAPYINQLTGQLKKVVWRR